MVILVKIVFHVSKSATIINIIYLYIVSKMTHPKMKMTILTLTTLTSIWRFGLSFLFYKIAELTGKQHKNVMQAIRNMEPAWTKTCGLKFQLTSRIIEQPNGGTREVPCYLLTKTECLYIATKFNDEARAKLVLRWEELEM